MEDDAWLEVSLNEDGVVFGRAEVEETVEEIIGLCSEYPHQLDGSVARVCDGSDDATSGGTAADAAMDAENSISTTHPMDSILRASERLV